MRFLTLMTASLLAAPAAFACDGVYDTGDLLDDLTQVEDALRADDAATAAQYASKMEGNIACLGEPIPYMIVGRIYRGIAVGKLMSGDDARGREWFLTALEVDPTFEYGTEDLSMDSPVRQTYLDLRAEADAPPVDVPDASFSEGKFYIDGGLTGSPRATLGRPHLVQREQDEALSGWVIEGNSFPSELLGAAVAEVEPDEDPADARRRSREAERAARDAQRARAGSSGGNVQVVRSPAKTPLMIGGAVAIVGAGALYYGSTVTRGQFDDALLEEDARKARQATNNLVIASAVLLAAGTSAFTWGVIIDDGPGVVVRGRF